VNSDTKSSMEFENEELYRQMIEKISARGGLDSLASSSGSTTATTLPNLAWELRFSHPILVFSLQDDGNDLSGFPDAFPITIRGSMDIMAYENIDIKSIHIQIDVSGMSVWNVEDLETTAPLDWTTRTPKKIRDSLRVTVSLN
uniref:Uncharacterized protein n=1 Tax=Fusarium oxysporum (strain Fo5176) TaxID=660025 RepID=A0A0D2XKI3_FUSOF